MRKKQYQIYGDLLHKHRPTIRSMIMEILYAKFVEIKTGKVTVYRENAKLPPFEEQKPDITAVAKYVAVISSANKVVEILKMNEKAADILLQNDNKFLGFSPDNEIVKIGTSVIDDKFVEELENEEN